MSTKLQRLSRSRPLFGFILLLALAFFAQLYNQGTVAWGQTPPQLGTQATRLTTIQSTQLTSFEANRGQADKNVDFLATGQGYAAQLRADSLTIHLNISPTAPKSATTSARPVSI